MMNASDQLMVYDLGQEGQLAKILHQVELPGIGSIARLTGNKEENMLYYGFTSFT